MNGAASSSTRKRAGRAGIALCGVVAGAMLGIGDTRADPPQTPAVSCNGGSLAAPPVFSQVSPGRAEYKFSGVCTARDSGRMLGYRVLATWTPSESNPANANAAEVFQVSTLSGPSQSFTVVMGARCEQDPWLHHSRCTRVGDNAPEELLELWPGLTDSAFPFNRNGIGQSQRGQLQAEYARANGGERSQRLLQGMHVNAGRPQDAALQQGAGVGHAADAVSLNPQPLPPRPPSDAAVQATSAGRRAAEAGIIIVSGTTPLREAQRTQAETAVDETASP
ncbi:MAG: hypothetical protein ABWX93_09415 [Pseudoxanthomonas sp.]